VLLGWGGVDEKCVQLESVKGRDLLEDIGIMGR
jgi:hypothetical protein